MRGAFFAAPRIKFSICNDLNDVPLELVGLNLIARAGFGRDDIPIRLLALCYVIHLAFNATLTFLGVLIHLSKWLFSYL